MPIQTVALLFLTRAENIFVNKKNTRLKAPFDIQNVSDVRINRIKKNLHNHKDAKIMITNARRNLGYPTTIKYTPPIYNWHNTFIIRSLTFYYRQFWYVFLWYIFLFILYDGSVVNPITDRFLQGARPCVYNICVSYAKPNFIEGPTDNGEGSKVPSFHDGQKENMS